MAVDKTSVKAAVDGLTHSVQALARSRSVNKSTTLVNTCVIRSLDHNAKHAGGAVRITNAYSHLRTIPNYNP